MWKVSLLVMKVVASLSQYIFISDGGGKLSSIRRDLSQSISDVVSDGYYVAYKPIALSCIFFMFIEMKFIHCHSCVMFAMKSMSMCND